MGGIIIGLDEAEEYKFCPIPPGEQGIKTSIAEYFFQITAKKAVHVEGICMDRKGDFYFTNITEAVIYKLDMASKELYEIYHGSGIKPTAVKIHRDGRLFVCLVGGQKPGGIMVMKPDGTDCHMIIEGIDVDDLVFDSSGGFYFTHYVGNAYTPIGAVYYVSSDLREKKIVIENMAKPNGIALSPDEKWLWITETDRGRLVRHPAVGQEGHTSVVYRFTGAVGPDSCSVDSEGNVYVALFGQGRVMVFNSSGFPIYQILMPNRNLGHNLFSTHPFVTPGSYDLYIVASDDYGDEGSWIFHAESVAKGHGKAFAFS